MPNIKPLTEAVFLIDGDDAFNDVALEVFKFQYRYNKLYKHYVDELKRNVSRIKHYSEIPFLPIEFFKSYKVTAGNFTPEAVFTSSGTTGMSFSRHLVADVSLYEKSFIKSFQYFFGNIKDYVILALLPSYMERNGSSLVYMAEKLINISPYAESGFYLNEYEQLAGVLKRLKQKGSKTLLLGVTYALLDLAERFPVDFPELMIMETGGMKGKRKEMVRQELHGKLTHAFRVEKIYSEYGMTELLSQAYSKGKGLFQTPPWMKVLIRDTNDPFTYLPYGKTGGINIIDLANINSCSFIETKDMGRMNPIGEFEILGRFDNSDIRGCNLLIG